MEAKGVSGSYIRIIKDMYEESLTSVSNLGGDSEYFQVKLGLYQGSTLSHFLHMIVMDALTNGIQGEVPWCMLFADDIVLVDDSGAGLASKLDLWRGALEGRGFRLSRTKTEYVKFNFGGTGVQESDLQLEMISS